MKKIFFTFISVLGFALTAAAQLLPTLPSLPSRILDVATADEAYMEDGGYMVFDAYTDIFYYDGSKVDWSNGERRTNSEDYAYNPPAPFRAQSAGSHPFVVPNYVNSKWCTYAMRFTHATEVILLGRCGNTTDYLHLDVYEVNDRTVAGVATAQTSLTGTSLKTCSVNGLDGTKEYVVYVYGLENTNNRFYQIAFRSADYKRWDFSSLSLPYADGTLWRDNSGSVKNEAAINNAELTAKMSESAEAVVYEPTRGLYFTSNSGTASNSFQIKSNQIVLNRQNLTIRIPNCKAGQRITIRAKYNAEDRFLVAKTNLTETSIWNNSSTEWQDLVAIVDSNGDVEIGTNDKTNVSIQSIVVERILEPTPEPCRNCFTITIH